MTDTGRFEAGERLFFERYYGDSEWLRSLNSDWPHPPTHVAPTEVAAKRWLECVGPREGAFAQGN